MDPLLMKLNDIGLMGTDGKDIIDIYNLQVNHPYKVVVVRMYNDSGRERILVEMDKKNVRLPYRFNHYGLTRTFDHIAIDKKNMTLTTEDIDILNKIVGLHIVYIGGIKFDSESEHFVKFIIKSPDQTPEQSTLVEKAMYHSSCVQISTTTMDDVLKKFNNIGTLGTNGKVVMDIDEMEVDNPYKVVDVRMYRDIQERILVEIDEVNVRLPKRFNNVLTAEDIYNLNKIVGLHIVYVGQIWFGTNTPENCVKFIIKNPDQTSEQSASVEEFSTTTMDEVLKKVNNIGTLGTNGKPVISVHEMRVNNPYKVVNVRMYDIGQKIILVEIDEVNVRLPERFNNVMTAENIYNLNNLVGLHIIHNGPIRCGSCTYLELIKFIIIE